MKDKNLPDDIKNKSLNELTELANNIIKNLENKKKSRRLAGRISKINKIKYHNREAVPESIQRVIPIY